MIWAATSSRTGFLWLITTAIALAALWLPPQVYAQEASPSNDVTALPSGNNHVQPFDTMEYLIVEGDEFDPDAVMERRAEFRPVESAWIDFGEVDGSVWLIARISNASDQSGQWLIDIQRPFVDELIVQKRAGNGTSETLLSVNRDTRFDERAVVSQYLVAPLRMESGEAADILVGLKSATGSWMPLTFVTEERMRTAHMQEARTNWMINGAMLALVIVALAMGRLVGWPLTASFAVYVALGALFVANNEGYLHRFIWPNSMGVYEPANLILLTGMMMAVLQFARLFAGLRTNYPKVNRAIMALQGILVAAGVNSMFFWQFEVMRWAIFMLVPLAALGYFSSTILAWRARVLGAAPFITGSLAVMLTVLVMALVLFSPGRFPLTVALDYFHFALLLEGLAFLVAMLVRMLAIQSDLNRSLQTEVIAAREKLALTEALQESRNRYDQARAQAENMRTRLASTTHDLQQPLISLRQGLTAIADRDPGRADEIDAALNYLQSLTESGLDTSDAQSGERPDIGVEAFQVSLVLESCASMFRAEAQSKAIHLRVRSSDLQVTTEPIELMRSVSNLVSNALKHSGASKILVAAQSRGDRVRLSVIDNGRGMADGEVTSLAAAGMKGIDSEGHGLGLALVSEFANRHHHNLTIRSHMGQGTCISLSVPKRA